MHGIMGSDSLRNKAENIVLTQTQVIGSIPNKEKDFLLYLMSSHPL